jgi:uncharacterized membrane protein
MATIAEGRKPVSLQPQPFDRLLAAGAVILFGFVLTALARGVPQWGQVPPVIWGHILTILTALVLTPIMLLRRRGDRLHRRLGYVWVTAMGLTAALTFGIRTINPSGGLSWIHLLSAWTLIQVPLIVWSARTHNLPRHRASVRGMVLGALIIAGIFTFPFNRLMGHWLFG